MSNWRDVDMFFDSKYKDEKSMVQILARDWNLPRTQIVALAVRELFDRRDQYDIDPYTQTGRRTRTQRILEVMKRDSERSSSTDSVQKDV